MNRTYQNCAKKRQIIDRVLHQNAILFQNGVANAKRLERENLQAIREVDPTFIGFLLDASDDA